MVDVVEDENVSLMMNNSRVNDVLSRTANFVQNCPNLSNLNVVKLSKIVQKCPKLSMDKYSIFDNSYRKNCGFVLNCPKLSKLALLDNFGQFEIV